MPAPANTSAATAVDIGSTLPYEVTQNVHDAGTTYTVWYVLPAKTIAYAANFWAFGDLVTYEPKIKIWSGSVGSLTAEHTGNENKPIQFVVQANTTYFLEIITNLGNPSPALLQLSVVASPNGVAPQGSVIIPDDIDGSKYPAAVLDEENGDVLRFVINFSSSEQGDSLHSIPVVLMADINTNNVKLWDARDFSVLVDPVGSLTSFARIRANHGTDQFYVSVGTTFYIVSSAGAVVHTDTGAFSENRTALAGSNDASTVYSAGDDDGDAIERYVIATETPGSNLAAGITDYRVSDILVLEDDSIVVGYWNGDTSDFMAKRYSAAGATLNTYNFGAVALNMGPPRLGYAIDHSQFLAFYHPITPDGSMTYERIRASDGVVLRTWTREEYGGGDYRPDANEDPARSGPSPSCPIMMIPIALGDAAGGETGVIGPYVWVHCLREVPSAVAAPGGGGAGGGGGGGSAGSGGDGDVSGSGGGSGFSGEAGAGSFDAGQQPDITCS